MNRPSWTGVAGAMVLTVAAVTGIRAAAPDGSIVDAARRGDKQAVRTLLQAGKVGQTAPDGSTALHWAVENNDQEMVALLLKAGAKATAATRYEVQPISLAAVNGNAAILEALVAAGADVNATLPGGETVLMTAARGGQLPAVQFLIAKGANVNAKDTTLGQTALMWAAARDNADVAKVLIEAGADINARTNNPSRGGGRASESGNTFQAPAPTGFTPLLFATRAGAIDATRVLIEAGANVNDTLSDGQSALVVAAANAHWQLADFLLD